MCFSSIVNSSIIYTYTIIDDDGSGTTPNPTEAPKPCKDTKPASKCKRIKKQRKCRRGWAKRQCPLTCGKCT